MLRYNEHRQAHLGADNISDFFSMDTDVSPPVDSFISENLVYDYFVPGQGPLPQSNSLESLYGPCTPMPITMQSGFSSRPRPSSSLNLLSWSPSGAAAPASNSTPIHAQRPRALSPYSHPATTNLMSLDSSYIDTAEVSYLWSDLPHEPSYNNQVASPPFVPSSPSSSHSTGSRRSRENSPKRAQPKDPNERRRIPCLITGCNRRFTSQYTLKVHMEAHKPKPRASFPCTLGCSERFSRQHDRLRHEVAKHGKVCEFSCHECGRFFSSSKTLGNHKCPAAQGGTRWVNT